jgi:type III secretion system HrpB4-like protein
MKTAAQAGASFPFARMAAAFAAWERNACEAARWVHGSWWAPALDLPPATVDGAFDSLAAALTQAGATRLAICSRALLRAMDVAPPRFDLWRGVNESARPNGVAMLDTLPVEDGLRVLRMRALLLRRADVRRLIDKQSRQRLAQWIGVPLETLTAMPAHGAAHTAAANAPDIARLVARGHLPPLDQADGQRLACEGYLLLAGEGEPCPLLRLALPRDLPAPWPGMESANFDAGGAAFFAARLPELFPECAW